MRKMIVHAGLLLAIGSTAHAQGFFLSAGDDRFRDDLTLLIDEGVINLPVNEWPLARKDVEQALLVVKAEDLHDVALFNALARVKSATALSPDSGLWRIREVAITGGQSSLLRTEGALGRENGELAGLADVTTERYGITIAVSGAFDASDGGDLRFDGSDVSAQLGNWIFSVNQLDRWWGPGRDGSLILSNNARPMPAISLDRVRSSPLDVPLLRLLGSWRFSGFLGLMEGERSDVDRPVFMGMRLSFKPAPIFEFGLSRSAQFCGKGRSCDLKTFGRVLIGQDNRGRRGLPDDADIEPGNQMAGFDVRVVSPFRSLPIAIYGQQIGEDNSSTGIPERYVALYGGEMWFLMRGGSVFRTHVEYANTKVKWYQARDEFDVAYVQSIFTEGYRYYGRNIGHTADGDSEVVSLGASLTTGGGHRWALQIWRGRLDRCCTVGANSRISRGPSRYRSGQISWKGDIRSRLQVGIELGLEDQSPGSAGGGNGAFGFVQVRKRL